MDKDQVAFEPASPIVSTLKEDVMPLSSEEREQLANAKFLLENPSLAVKITNAIGTPIERGLGLLPAGWQTSIQKATNKALMSALKVAVGTMDHKKRNTSSPKLHKGLVALSGAVGGAFGLPALAIELPVSTTIMLRSIADIARSHGEEISKIEVRIACLQVFALGGSSASDNSADIGYYSVRALLARSVSEAAQYVVEKGMAEEGAPAIVRLITKIAARFSIPVSEKTAAQSVPVIGAFGGALINTMFIDHFQGISEGHFTVRQLERKYGFEVVKKTYEQLPCIKRLNTDAQKARTG